MGFSDTPEAKGFHRFLPTVIQRNKDYITNSCQQIVFIDYPEKGGKFFLSCVW